MSAQDFSSQAATAAERIRTRLELELLQGLYVPGSRLDEQELAERYGVSRTPVREALKAIAAGGLLEIRAHAGAFVSRPAPQRLLEMFETMAALESACAGHAARRASDAQVQVLADANRACADHAATNDAPAFYAANQMFHDAIYAASGNTYLASQTLALRRRLEPWRRAITARKGLMRQSVTEHAAILKAIAAGEGERAAQHASRHLDTLGQDALLLLGGTAFGDASGVGSIVGTARSASPPVASRADRLRTSPARDPDESERTA